MFLTISIRKCKLKTKHCDDAGPRSLPVEHVFDHLNQEVHDLSAQLIAEREQAPVAANTVSLSIIIYDTI